MSSTFGTVTFNDGLVKYYHYNGTTDICYPELYEDLTDIYSEGTSWTECTCGNTPEEVEIYSDYGSGSQWVGEACRHCNVITKDNNPWFTDDY